MNPQYDDYTLFIIDPIKGALDYRIADTGRPMQNRELEVVNLDSLYRCGEPPAMPPDLLSLDTEGSEYEILQGASQTLEDSVLAIRLEVAFRPVYKNQKLFGDLCHLLSGLGFQFVKMLKVYPMFPSREPLGLRAGGFDTFGEALFFRTQESICQAPTPEALHVRLLKMAFIALNYGQLEYALACLRNLNTKPQSLAKTLEQRAYVWRQLLFILGVNYNYRLLIGDILAL